MMLIDNFLEMMIASAVTGIFMAWLHDFKLKSINAVIRNEY
jgi:hypothetical protein